MMIRKITDDDRQPGNARHLFGMTLDGLPMNDVRVFFPTDPGRGYWKSPDASGISMPMIATHVVVAVR